MNCPQKNLQLDRGRLVKKAHWKLNHNGHTTIFVGRGLSCERKNTGLSLERRYTEIPIDPYKDTNDTASNNNKTWPDVEINAKLFKWTGDLTLLTEVSSQMWSWVLVRCTRLFQVDLLIQLMYI